MPGTHLSNPKAPAAPNAPAPNRAMERGSAAAPVKPVPTSLKPLPKFPGLTTSMRTSGQLAQMPTPLKPVGMEHNASVFDPLKALLRRAERGHRMRNRRNRLPYRSAEELMRLPTKTPGAATKTPRHPDDDLFDYGPRSPSAPISPPQAANTLPYDPNEW